MKSQASFTLLLLFALSTAASAQDARTVWWERRVDTLSSAVKSEQAAATDKRLTAAYEREIRRGKDYIAQSSRESHPSAPAPAGPSAKETSPASSSEAAAACRTLRSLTQARAGADETAAMKSSITPRVADLLKSEACFDDTALVREIASQAISADQWTRFTLEARFAASEKANTPSTVESLPVWNEIKFTLSHEFSRYKSMYALLDSAGADTPRSKARYFLRNPLSLDSVYFSQLTRKQASESAPETPRDAAILKIDRYRVRAIAAITGKEDGEYFTRAGERIDAIISSSYRQAAAPERVLARKRESLAFMKWVSDSRKTSGDSLATLYRSRVERYTSWADSLASLVSRASGVSAGDDRELQLAYVVSIRSVPGTLSRLESALTIEKDWVPHLSAEQIRAMRTARAGFARHIRAIQDDVASSVKGYSSVKSRRAEKAAISGAQRVQSLASLDVELVTTALDQYYELFGSLLYAKKAFHLYRDTYESLKKEAQGRASTRLDACIDAGSLMPAARGFNAEKIRQEHRTRTALRREIKYLVAALSSLNNHYSQKGISVKANHTPDELEAMHRAVDVPVEVMVGDWKISETNFEEIDRKAAHSLASIKKRSQRDVMPALTTRAAIGASGLSLMIPEGWSERSLGESDNGRGLTASYANDELNSTIDIAGIPHRGATLRDAADSWLRSMRSIAVKGRFGLANTGDFYWSLSKERRGIVRETRVFTRNSTDLVVSGTIPADRHHHFKKIMEAVFDSIQADGKQAR